MSPVCQYLSIQNQCISVFSKSWNGIKSFMFLNLSDFRVSGGLETPRNRPLKLLEYHQSFSRPSFLPPLLPPPELQPKRPAGSTRLPVLFGPHLDPFVHLSTVPLLLPCSLIFDWCIPLLIPEGKQILKHSLTYSIGLCCNKLAGRRCIPLTPCLCFQSFLFAPRVCFNSIHSFAPLLGLSFYRTDSIALNFLFPSGYDLISILTAGSVYMPAPD